MKISISKGVIFILQIGLFVLLEVFYSKVVYPTYDDMGFKLVFQTEHFIMGWLFFVIPLALVFLIAKTDFLFSILNLLISFFLAPNVILYQYMNTDVLIALGIASIVIFSLLLQRVMPALKSQVVPLRKRNFYLLSIVSVLLIPFFLTFGLPQSFTFSLEDVYDLRELSAGMVNKFTDYTYSLLGSWLLPTLIVIGFLRRAYFSIIFSTVAILYLFLVTGNKITLFTLFPTYGFLFFKGYTKKLTMAYIVVITIFSFGLWYSVNVEAANGITDLLVRRFLFLPALLNHQYFEFFEGVPVFYSHSFLSSFFDYPYDALPPKLIGFEYYSGNNATNGIISDGFLNVGIVGVFITTSLASVIIVYFDKLKIHAAFLGVFFLLIQRFIDTSFFTLMLTHGLFLFLIIAKFLLKNTESDFEFKQ